MNKADLKLWAERIAIIAVLAVIQVAVLAGTHYALTGNFDFLLSPACHCSAGCGRPSADLSSK